MNNGSCNLSVPFIPFGKGKGRVKVSLGADTVKFTISAAGYFDPPGSTITFRVFSRNGNLYLQQKGYAPKAGAVNDAGVYFLRRAYVTWVKQTWNFQNALRPDFVRRR